jgi:hypothetical protein
MKHIKIFEEYSDDELKDLMGDLESIGHDYRLIPGQDFGFGKLLDKKNTGEEILFLSPKTVSQLSKKGFFNPKLVQRWNSKHCLYKTYFRSSDLVDRKRNYGPFYVLRLFEIP